MTFIKYKNTALFNPNHLNDSDKIIRYHSVRKSQSDMVFKFEMVKIFF